MDQYRFHPLEITLTFKDLRFKRCRFTAALPANSFHYVHRNREEVSLKEEILPLSRSQCPSLPFSALLCPFPSMPLHNLVPWFPSIVDHFYVG